MASPLQVLAEAKRDQFKLAGCGLLWVVANTEIAIKIPDEPGAADAIEKRIYERLGTHRFILRYYGEGESVLGKGLVLQYLPAGTVERNLELDKYSQERILWPAQAVEAVKYIHSKGVIHCDIGIHNFLVQKDGSIVLRDFCSSILDGSKAAISTVTRYTRPIPLAERSLNRTKSDIFALGTVLYEISVGHRIYAEKRDAEVYKLFQRQQFPDTTRLVGSLRIVIESCWRDQYSSAEEVKIDEGFDHIPQDH